MHPSSFLTPLFGGALIGLAATLLLASLGRIAGVSGILGQVVTSQRSGAGWQLGFVLGLLGTGWLMLGPGSAPALASPATIIVAGLLVGFGTRMGSGCTSGHGVCGLSRLSLRSLVATCAFMGAAILVVLVTRHILAGGAS